MGFALWISVAGVALGIVQLVVVLSVMSGFQDVFRRNYTRISSDFIVIPRGVRASPPEGESAREKILGVEGVQAVTPVRIGQGMLVRGATVAGTVLEGIDPESSRAVTPWDEILLAPAVAPPPGAPWIWLGDQLAKKLKAGVGDTVDLMVPEGDSRRLVPFHVTAIAKFGIYDHDLRYARVGIEDLSKLFHRDLAEPLYKVRVAQGASIEATGERVRAAFAGRATIKLWSDVNHNVFLAVEHQKGMLFLVLEIVVALAAMNVVNLLMMSSHARRRDVAILRAMGMRFSSITAFFVGQGAMVGAVGIVAGIALGYVACAAIERWQPALLAESVYNVTRLPLRTEPADVLLVAVVGFVLCVVFSVIPALGAARGRPVDALRYE